MRIVLILALTASCFAQVQGNRPSVIDSRLDGNAINGGVGGVIVWGESLSAGQTIALCLNTDSTGSFSISDTLGSTWTMTSHTNTGGSGAIDVWMAYTTLSSSGAETITLTETGGSGVYMMSGARATGLGSIDGAVATATSAPPTGSTVSTISTSKATTSNGDILFNCSGGAAFGGHADTPGSNVEYLGKIGTVNLASLISMVNATSIQTYTPTHYIWGSSSNRAMQTIAFKPSTILVTDTVMPDGQVGVAYSAQLHGVGGVAGLTYACTGLPSNGLSLNTSTGKITGATPTSGTVSIGCTVTDGSTTSATDNLTIKIGAGLNTPAIRQINNTWGGDTLPSSFNMTVNCGSTIIFIVRGQDTHGQDGFLMTPSGANNYVRDSFGSTIRRVKTFIPGNDAFPVVVFAIGPITQSGVDTISLSDNQASSLGRTVSLASEITGAFIDDDGAGISLMTGGAVTSGTLSVSYTSVVNNTLLLALMDSDSTVTWSLGAPFSVNSSGGDAQGTTMYGNALIASPATTTATGSFTVTPLNNTQFDAVLVPLRPALPMTSCVTFTGTGEKLRRQVY